MFAADCVHIHPVVINVFTSISTTCHDNPLNKICAQVTHSESTTGCRIWTESAHLRVFVRPWSCLNWRCVKSVMETCWNILVQYWMGSPDLSRAQVDWTVSEGIGPHAYTACIFQICTVNPELNTSALNILLWKMKIYNVILYFQAHCFYDAM